LVKIKKKRKWSEEIETHFILGVSSAISPRDKKKTETEKIFWQQMANKKRNKKNKKQKNSKSSTGKPILEKLWNIKRKTHIDSN